MDHEGHDFGTLAEAREHALDFVRGILAADAAAGSYNLDRRVEITDATGKLLMSVKFSEALTVDPASSSH